MKVTIKPKSKYQQDIAKRYGTTGWVVLRTRKPDGLVPNSGSVTLVKENQIIVLTPEEIL